MARARTEADPFLGLGSRGPIVGPPTLTARLPAALLPVRLETRLTDESGTWCLLLRIYPDQFHVHAHEGELTAAEREAGIGYWDVLWNAGRAVSLDEQKRAWRILATKFGPERAAWIAKQLTPRNLGLRPQAPTLPGTAPNPLPDYPASPDRPSSWEQAPLAACLPDRWAVYLYKNHGLRQTAVGNPIRRPLAVGPDPSGAANAPDDPKELQVDEGMRWMVDFDEAVDAGMALRIELTGPELRSGIDEVLVVGLASQGPLAGAARLVELFDAHHYTDGLALVPQGTPTNNTPGAPSGYSDRDPGFERSFAAERADPLVPSDGRVVARALGVPETIFEHVEHADRADQENAAAMAVAVWPSTLGYFLDQMMDPVFTPDQVEQARVFFRDRVRGRGPVPAFRVGDTPLGILPTTAVWAYQAGAGPLASRLIGFLLRVLFWFRGAANASPRIGVGDPKDALTKILAMDASARSYKARHAIGEEWLRSLVNLLLIGNLDEVMEKQSQAGRSVLNRYNFPDWDPRIIHVALSRRAYDVPFPIVQEEPVSETEGLTPFTLEDGSEGNYISWISGATVDDLENDDTRYPGGQAPTALLYKVLRQSALHTYVRLAGQLAVAAELFETYELKEPELVDVRAGGATTLTAQRLLATPVPGYGRANEPIGEYLVGLAEPSGSLTPLAEFRAALDRLAALPSAELERLFTETLDACSHRIDVWATAIATHLLEQQRNPDTGSRYGTHVGGYGFVLDVTPEAPRAAVTGLAKAGVDALDARRAERLDDAPTPPPAREARADSGGFIHAPSLAQARAAAVLRNGYLTHRGSSGDGAFAIDLSSRRVRRALWCLEGIRAGQPLGALLGYRFEAALQRDGLAEYIPAFRNRYPLVAEKLTRTNARADLVSAPNVVDGLLLLRRAPTELPGWAAPLPTDTGELNTVRAILTDLGDIMDALGDVSIAESVYQLLQGNYGRAGGLLDALSRGDQAPDPQILRTPRSGIDVTHRVLLLFTGDPPRVATWPGGGHPRATAEPRLDAWLSNVLPDPAKVRCEVRRVDAPGTPPVTVRLDDLDLGPLDVLALADAAVTPQESELEQHIRYEALRTLPAATTEVEIRFAREAGWFPDELSFPELLVIARSARDLLGGARPLAPQDLVEPQLDAGQRGAVIDVGELATRADGALADLDTARQELETLIGSATVATIDDLRASMITASLYGASGAVPASRAATAAALAALEAQATPVLAELERRHAEAEVYDDAFTRAGAAATALRDHLLGLLERVLGDAFVALPQFTPATVTADAGLDAVLDAANPLATGNEDALARWVQQLTHVRPGVARLDALNAVRTLIGASGPPAPNLGQLPFRPQDRWVGLGADANGSLPEAGRVAFFAELAVPYDGTDPHSGLLLDEWPERIPVVEQSSGLAFHYDAPNAAAPQAVLLAVCPDDRRVWDEDFLASVVYETLDFVKHRPVDYATLSGFKNLPESIPLSLSLGLLGQVLPGLVFAFNPDGQAVSAHFIDIN